MNYPPINDIQQNPDRSIAALVPYKIFPAKMGGQKGIALFYTYLSKLVPVTIISTANNEVPRELDAVFLKPLGNSKARYINPFLFFKMRNILIKYKCSALILEHPYYGWLGMLLKRSCRIKLVVHSHNIESSRFQSTGKWWWRILWQYERMVHRAADQNFFKTTEDMDFAIKHFQLDASRCHIITYGIEIDHAPLPRERIHAKKILQSLYKLDEGEKILLFNGTLDYKPNQDAVDWILEQINPLLLKQENYKYKIIICGKGLPAGYLELKAYSDKNIIYAGFVEDIDAYFKGADLFINPVIEGGGIKTKLVESLGFNLSCVSTKNGAIGIPASVTGNKLLTVNNGDWQAFVHAILLADTQGNIPPAFYDHFYWGNIAAKAKLIIA